MLLVRSTLMCVVDVAKVRIVDYSERNHLLCVPFYPTYELFVQSKTFSPITLLVGLCTFHFFLLRYEKVFDISSMSLPRVASSLRSFPGPTLGHVTLSNGLNFAVQMVIDSDHVEFRRIFSRSMATYYDTMPVTKTTTIRCFQTYMHVV